MYDQSTPSFRACLIVVLILLTVIFLSGCLSRTWRDFRPLEQESPIVMFDRYEISVLAYASTNHNTYIDVAFLSEHRDTLHLDTLPIFTIDTVCFYGDCLDSTFCIKPRSWTDAREVRPAMWYPRPIAHEGIRSDDLFLKDSLVVPSGFELLKDYTLPLSCTDSSVTVELWGRLIDRTTGIDIGRQRKSIRFMITPRKRRYMFSQTSDRPQEYSQAINVHWPSSIAIVVADGSQWVASIVNCQSGRSGGPSVHGWVTT